MKEQTNENELNETGVFYQRTNRVQVYHSFQEMNNADAVAMAAVPVKDRIKNTVELILRAYGVTREQLIARKKTYKVSIISRGK